jgi:hypothetical protein
VYLPLLDLYSVGSLCLLAIASPARRNYLFSSHIHIIPYIACIHSPLKNSQQPLHLCLPLRAARRWRPSKLFSLRALHLEAFTILRGFLPFSHPLSPSLSSFLSRSTTSLFKTRSQARRPPSPTPSNASTPASAPPPLPPQREVLRKQEETPWGKSSGKKQWGKRGDERERQFSVGRGRGPHRHPSLETDGHGKEGRTEQKRGGRGWGDRTEIIKVIFDAGIDQVMVRAVLVLTRGVANVVVGLILRIEDFEGGMVEAES